MRYTAVSKTAVERLAQRQCAGLQACQGCNNRAHPQMVTVHKKLTGLTTSARVGTSGGHIGPFGNDFIYLKVGRDFGMYLSSCGLRPGA